VLPLLANQLHIAFGSTQLAFVQTKGLRQRVTHQSHVAIDADDDSHASALANLDQHLSTANYPSGTYVHITLASEYVRYLVLPEQVTTMSETEKLAYATAAMQEVYGYLVNDWQLSMDDVPPNQPSIVAGVDRSLIEALEALIKKHQLKLQSIQPYMARAFNRLSKQIGQKDATLVMVERDRVLLMQLNQGACHQIKQYVRSEEWLQGLPAWLGREQMLANNDTNQVLLYAPAHKKETIQLQQPWKLSRIGLQQQLNANYAMLEAAL